VVCTPAFGTPVLIPVPVVFPADMICDGARNPELGAPAVLFGLVPYPG
jgi:hypothetical protein